MNFNIDQDHCNNSDYFISPESCNQNSFDDNEHDYEEFFVVKQTKNSTKKPAKNSAASKVKSGFQDMCNKGCLAYTENGTKQVKDKEQCKARCLDKPALGTEIGQCMKSKHDSDRSLSLRDLYDRCTRNVVPQYGKPMARKGH